MNFEESYYDDDAIGGKAASGNKGSSHFFNKQKEDRYIYNPIFHSSGDLRSRRTEQGGSTEMLCFQAVT